MRLHEIAAAARRLDEFIATKPVYDAALAATAEALRRSALEAATLDADAGYSGRVLSAVRTALVPLLHEALGGRLRRLVFLNVVQTDDAHMGGGAHDRGETLVVTVRLPARWFASTPNMFFHVVRENDRDWAAMVARCFVHEVLHCEQALRSEPGELPVSGIQSRIDTRKRARGKLAADASASLRYLARKDEIDAQALSAALELLHHYAPGAALDLFKPGKAKELAWIAGDPFAVPHLHNYWRFARQAEGGRDAWRAFLRALFKHLRHHAAEGREPGASR